MANDSSRAGILDGLLRDAGIPIDGLSVNDINATPVGVTVQFRPEATGEQQALAAQIVAQFDWRLRRPLSRSTVVTALNNLTTNQRNTLLAHMLSEFLRANPAVAAQIGVATGTPVTVDEIDPT